MPTHLILLIVALLVGLGLLGAYAYKPRTPEIDKTPIVTTNTVPSPKPVVTAVTEPSIFINPSVIQQGELALITVEGLTSTSSVKSFTFDNRPLVTFLYDGKVTALLGVDVRAATGTFPLLLTLKDGKQVRKNFSIQPRPLIQASFGIPDKLGGNTPQAERELLSTLRDEARIINAIPTSMEKLWSEDFGSPLSGTLSVSDAFGYTRITGNSTLIHKGVDLIAPMGTPIYAMNRGVVRFSGFLRNYGNAVVIDHGFGLQTVYMHLSETSATNGQTVEKGGLIGKSGDTGYVLDPHLHLTVRIWDVSVDPIKFLEILGE